MQIDIDKTNNISGNKRIAKNTMFLYIRLVFVLLVSLYTSRVILGTLGVTDYGIYNVVAGFVSMFALLSTSLTNSVQRFYNYEIGKSGNEGMTKVFVTSLYILIIIAIIIVVLGETIGIWYIQNKLNYPEGRVGPVFFVFQSSLLALVFVVLYIPFSAAIIARERIGFYSVVTVIDVILKLVAAIIVPYFGFDNLIVYAILICGISLIDLVLYFTYAKLSFKELCFQKSFDVKLFKQMFRFTGWSAMTGFSSAVMDQGINLIMNFFYGPVVNAARGITFQIKGALLGFVMNITTAVKPQLTESYAAGDIQRSKQLMFATSKFLFLSFFIVVLPLMCEIDFVLRLWLGDNVPEYTNIFVILVLITALVDILVSPISLLMNADGDIALFNSSIAFWGLLYLPIAYVVLKHGAQPEAVFIIGFFISLVMLIVAILIMQHKTDVTAGAYVRGVIKPIFLTVSTSIIIPIGLSKVINGGALRFVVVLLTSFILSIIVGFYMGLNKMERELVRQLVNKVKERALVVVKR